MNSTYQTGDQIKAKYKTGEYLGRFVEYRNDKYAVVEILAVLRHPTQGDLHYPNEAEVPLFHQRRALAFREKAVVNLPAISAYEGTIPEYDESLRDALHQKLDKLGEREDAWAMQSKTHLHELEKDYFKKGRV